MKNKNFVFIIIFLISLVFGSYLAISNLKSSTEKRNLSIINGNWKVNPKMDLKDDYQRAYIARIGLFALDEKEVLYFLSSKDDKGRLLSSEYDYEIIGSVPKGRYWSYTLYGKDYFLVKNKENIFGINKENFDPKHNIIISSKEQLNNWLPSGNEKQFHITLRLYNPYEKVYKNLKSIKLPIIRRLEK
tara:strand:- start:574 stop:1137 length:564 start_codon:yes stop_codon:yes gene_type:complete